MGKKESMNSVQTEELGVNSLVRPAGIFSLLGLAISAVIVGEFAGWNQGLIEGGFGGMLIATLLIILMYGCLCISMAELSALMPFTGGVYGFARAALGPWAGLMAGISQIIEYQLALSTIVVAIGMGLNSVIKAMAGITILNPILWSVVIAVFLGLNSWDTKLFFRSAIILSIAPLMVLVAFWFLAIPHFDISYLLLNVSHADANRLLPNGLVGIAWALPFAVWFFLSIEVVTLAGEEAQNPKKNIPKAFFWSFLILTIAALATLFLNAGIPLGIETVGKSDAPLLIGFQALVGNQFAPVFLTLLILIGSIASFHSTIYAAGRGIFSLARGGYFPTALAKTSEHRNTPYIALIVVAVLTFILAAGTLFLSNEGLAIGILLNMSVLGAIISYSLTLVSFVVIRYRYPKLARPYVSPLGVTGAITGLLIAAFTLILMFTNADYRLGLMGCMLIYALGALMYVYGKKSQNGNAPEEAFARTLEEKHPSHQRESNLLNGGHHE